MDLIAKYEAMRTEAAIHEIAIKSQVDFDSLDTAALEVMAEAGQEIVEIHRLLTKTGDNVVGELIKGHETFFEWDHYPPGDVYDRETHGQYYYHAHAADQRFADEHGHFHTFIRPRGMPRGIKPAPVPNFTMPEDPDDALSHFVAVAMNPEGFPFRLFTVNRWVTGEVWYSGEDVCTLLDYFKIEHMQPSWAVNRWITAMMRLFKPQIVALVRARDRTVEDWARAHPGEDVYEDRNLEVTSCVDISVEDQVRAVARSLMGRG